MPQRGGKPPRVRAGRMLAIEVEPLAHLARRIEAALGDRRIVVVRHRPEDDAVGRLRGLESGLRERGAARRAAPRSPIVAVRERQPKPEAPIGRAQHAMSPR